MLQVKLQVKFRILTIFNFCVKMGKLKKSTVLQNSKNLVFFYETSEKIRSSDQNLSLFQSPTLIIRYTVGGGGSCLIKTLYVKFTHYEHKFLQLYS